MSDDLITKAYGLLWLYDGHDQIVHKARRLLLSTLTKYGQMQGIEAARNDLIEVPAGSSVEKYPSGFGPRRDFLPNNGDGF